MTSKPRWSGRVTYLTHRPYPWVPSGWPAPVRSSPVDQRRLLPAAARPRRQHGHSDLDVDPGRRRQPDPDGRVEPDVAACLVIGSMPALLGLVIVMPVFGHATDSCIAASSHRAEWSPGCGENVLAIEDDFKNLLAPANSYYSGHSRSSIGWPSLTQAAVRRRNRERPGRVVLRQSAYGPDAATADIRGTTAKAGSCGWYFRADGIKARTVIRNRRRTPNLTTCSRWSEPLDQPSSSTGWPCGVLRYASAQACLRQSSDSASVSPFAVSRPSSAATQCS